MMVEIAVYEGSLLPVNRKGERVCAWDCLTPIRKRGQLFSEEHRERYEEAKKDLRRMFEGCGEEDILFCVLESVVRLSSPVSGFYYGSVSDLEECLPYPYNAIRGALVRLVNAGRLQRVGSYRDRPVYRVVDDEGVDDIGPTEDGS